MHPIFASYFVSSFGSFATTLPFSHTQIGVPYLHGPHRRQSFLASLVIYDVWSWPALQQLWFRFGILMYGPMICQWLIHSARDIMPALLTGLAIRLRLSNIFAKFDRLTR